jgi:hypothetical protein
LKQQTNRDFSNEMIHMLRCLLPSKSKAIKEALALAGAWGDRDWNEVEAELDRIRHSSKPTPPFSL